MWVSFPRTALLLAAVLGCCFPSYPGPLHAGQDTTISGLIQQGGYALADASGRLSAGFNSRTPFVPASTLKIVTALAALDILGPEHRFATRFFIDKDHNLTIQGEGDPFLLTEDITVIAQRLREAGVHEVGDLILDDSAFALAAQADGNDNTTNPYDAWNSALAVNFNSIAIKVSPERVISSDDPKVPLLPLMREIGKNLPPGHHLVNVNAFANRGTLPHTHRYTGELFRALLDQAQIPMHGTIKTGPPPATAAPILTHRSEKTVRDMLRLCLKYSNNFVANQLFLACGAARFGLPANWDKGRTTLEDYIEQELNIPASDLIMVEGSGLSRHNRITPTAMLTVLERFAPHQELLAERHGVPLKSGTLTGVYCFAGYLPDQSHTPFTILLNQPQNNRDEILQILLAKRQGPATAARPR